MPGPPPKKLRAIAFSRRLGLACVVFILVTLVALPMARTLARDGWSVLKLGFFILFAGLVAQVAFASVVASVGWWLLRHGPDPIRIRVAEVEGETPAPPATAIVMPIYNEDTNRVFQGLRAMYQSLEETGHGGGFDFFILSDTSDTNHWIAEEKAWFDLCQQVQGFGRIFYRRRRVRLHHKSGNIADFCLRWGQLSLYDRAGCGQRDDGGIVCAAGRAHGTAPGSWHHANHDAPAIRSPNQ